MFGYVQPDTPYLFVKDDTLYKALYCGVCKAIGSSCSQIARMSLTYDIAFLSAVAHNVCNADVVVKRERCIAHPIRPRPIASRDELTEKLAAVNVILAQYKVKDDVYDSGKGRIKGLFLSGGYKKAKKKFPKIDKIVKEGYYSLSEKEKRGETSVDMVCDSFAELLAKLSDEVFAEYATESTHKLFYAIGKWIYLIDALDDFEKDVKKKNYNLFVTAYGETDFKIFAEKHFKEVDFIFSSVFSAIAEEAEKVKFYFNGDLIKNILLRGIPAAYRRILKTKFEKINPKGKTDGGKKAEM